jgi:hypothetical protein
MSSVLGEEYRSLKDKAKGLEGAQQWGEYVYVCRGRGKGILYRHSVDTAA